MALSAAIRLNTPTRPREGSSHLNPACGTVMEIEFIAAPPLFVLPVRIVWVLEIPERAAASHGWNDGKVICGWRRTGRPLKRPRVPGIAPRIVAFEVRPH